MTEPTPRQRGRSWPVPTGWFVLLVALAGVAYPLLPLPDWGEVDVGPFDLHWRFLAVNGTVLGLLCLDAIASVRPGVVEVERELPRALTVGQDLDARWRLRNRGRRAVSVGVADDVPASFGLDSRRFALRLPAGGEATAALMGSPTRRGRFVLDELVVRTTGPLHLARWQQRRSEADEVRVLPPFWSQRDADLALHRARTFDAGLRSVRGTGAGTDFDSLRELTPDDQTRHIDWAATARRGRPIVRTYRTEQNQTVMVALDTGRLMAGSVAGVPRLEWGMDGAMLLAELATGLGDRMGLLGYDRSVHTTLDPTSRRGQRRAVTEAVFDLQPALAESEFAVLTEYVLARHRRRAMIVVITELVSEVLEEFVLPALPSLTRKHLVVVAALRDPDLVAWAGPEGGVDEDGAFLRAEAARTLDAREQMAARLRGLGARVLDVEPADFGVALADTYLEAKDHGRI